MKLHHKIDTSSFVRDQHSGAVINTDREALQKYRSKKAFDQRVADLSTELVEIRNEVKQLRELYNDFVNTSCTTT